MDAATVDVLRASSLRSQRTAKPRQRLASPKARRRAMEVSQAEGWRTLGESSPPLLPSADDVLQQEARHGSLQPLPSADDVQATMHGSQLLADEVEYLTEQHRRQLRSATRTIEETVAARIEAQALEAAEAASADVAARLQRQQQDVTEQRALVEQSQRQAHEELMALKAAAVDELEAERSSMSRQLQAEREALDTKKRETQASLKREWQYVDLTSEVGEVFLRRTAEAEKAKKTAEAAEETAVAQMAIALEMQKEVLQESDAATEAALHLHSQAARAKWEADRASREAKEARRAADASVALAREQAAQAEARAAEQAATIERLQREVGALGAEVSRLKEGLAQAQQAQQRAAAEAATPARRVEAVRVHRQSATADAAERRAPARAMPRAQPLQQRPIPERVRQVEEGTPPAPTTSRTIDDRPAKPVGSRVTRSKAATAASGTRRARVAGAGGSATDYSTMRPYALRELCRKRGCPATGGRHELCAALQKDDAERLRQADTERWRAATDTSA